MALGAQSSQDFLRAGTSTKSMRLMNTFLDVLRMFTQHKFICFCLDDLQFADDESLDLIYPDSLFQDEDGYHCDG